MTWSIIAHDRRSGRLGVAIASRAFAVGATCVYVQPGIGAISSQAYSNPYLALNTLDALRAGQSARDALRAALQADPGRAFRQVHLLTASGECAYSTGQDCIGWAGDLRAPGVSVAGNMLSGPRVLEQSLQTFLAHDECPLAERLLRALSAGEAAGGDKRGRQAARVVVFAGEPYHEIDLRVDDHPDPIAELWRLYEVAHEGFMASRACTPTRDDPGGIYEHVARARHIEAFNEALGPVDFSRFWKR